MFKYQTMKSRSRKAMTQVPELLNVLKPEWTEPKATKVQRRLDIEHEKATPYIGA